MLVSKVQVSDLKNCAKLINSIKSAKFEVSGPDLLALAEALEWAGLLAKKMGEQYQVETKPEVVAPLKSAPAKKQAARLSSAKKK